MKKVKEIRKMTRGSLRTGHVRSRGRLAKRAETLNNTR